MIDSGTAAAILKATGPCRSICPFCWGAEVLATTLSIVAVVRTASLVQPAEAQTPNHTPPPGMTCPGDKLVWVNTRSGIYHFQGERYFGSTKQGKFICERKADKEGDRPTHNGQ